jgi:hypothetical protein
VAQCRPTTSSVSRPAFSERSATTNTYPSYGKPPCRLSADSAASSGDNGDFASKGFTHDYSYIPLRLMHLDLRAPGLYELTSWLSTTYHTVYKLSLTDSLL